MLRTIGLSALMLVLGGCGGGDDGGGSSASTGGQSAGGGGGGGIAVGGGSAVGGTSNGGAAGEGAGGGGAVGGDPGVGGSSNGCNNDTKHSLIGNRIVADVTWAAKTGISAGSGKMYIWTRTALDFGEVNPATGEIPATGEVTPCGSSIPPLSKTAIAGGGQVQTVIPDAVWDKPGMPKFKATGSLSGFDIGATITMDPIVSLVGLSMNDPTGPWPSSAKQITSVDPDSDGQPGILALPRTDPPFSAPPTSLFEALNPSGKRASEIYIVTRTSFQISGARDSCTSASGGATVQLLDNHVVGCKRNDGKICSAGESDFIDQNQPKFTVQSAAYQMVQLAPGATCADVRAAMPM
ncbi:MAG: hypothetical protein IPI67_22915 [Myxococcales bacterium]|nr:hypothetical protein [Myxococcales bacterium]